jgi:hypothetical protein
MVDQVGFHYTDLSRCTVDKTNGLVAYINFGLQVVRCNVVTGNLLNSVFYTFSLLTF